MDSLDGEVLGYAEIDPMMRWNSQKSQHRLIEKLQESMIFILFSVEKDLNWSHGILIKNRR